MYHLTTDMALAPYFGNDPFFNQIERAMDR